MDMTVTKTELAALLGVAVGTLPRLVTQGMPGPVASGGGRGKAARFDAVACVAWQRAELIARQTPGGTPRDEYLRALTDKARLDVSTRRGELVEIAQVEREFEDCANAVKSRMRRIPDAVADRVLTAGGAAQVKALLLREIDDALLELSQRADGPDPAVGVS